MSNWKATSAPFLSIIAVLLLAFAVTGSTAWENKCATFDEPLHLTGAWLQTHYDDFRCDPEDPPLWRYYVTLGTSKNELELSTSGPIYEAMLTDRGVEGEFTKNTFYYTAANDSDAVLSAARDRMIALGVLLGATVAWWAWRLRGPFAGVIAAAAFCFDPNFLAHAPLVKDDVPMALTFLLFAAAVWLLGTRLTPIRFAAVAILLGACLTVKFSGILALPILAISLLVRALLPGPWPTSASAIGTRPKRLAAAAAVTCASCLIAYVLLWACYRFRFAPGLDPDQQFDFAELLRISARHAAFAAYQAFNLPNPQIADFVAHWKPDFFFRAALWAGNHHLLPQTWVEGLLFTYGTAPGRDAFLLGTSAITGRWQYFPIAMAVKTPLATLAALFLATIYWIFTRRPIARTWDIFALAIVPVLYLAVAMRSDLNLGIRHVLPVYPFLFIFVGIIAADALVRFRVPTLILTALFVAGLATETYAAYPDFIPFFNIAAGGWRNGPNLLGDSNVDWGQDLPSLAEWQRGHPQYQIFLNYFGSADPRYYRIHYVNLPGSRAPPDESPSPTSPRIYAISGNAAHNPWLSDQDRDFYLGLFRQRPLAVLGHCIYLYNPP